MDETGHFEGDAEPALNKIGPKHTEKKQVPAGERESRLLAPPGGGFNKISSVFSHSIQSANRRSFIQAAQSKEVQKCVSEAPFCDFSLAFCTMSTFSLHLPSRSNKRGIFTYSSKACPPTPAVFLRAECPNHTRPPPTFSTEHPELNKVSWVFGDISFARGTFSFVFMFGPVYLAPFVAPSSAIAIALPCSLPEKVVSFYERFI
ncbi:hypothetical protein GWI33_012044 [Rhynchophorus ferrugineus]|uniref:Uncharacterized protein n=1 Tax=Rhynchophorus ferrugineus TaxID=354439 RepID=A0A834IJI8_RHYFE|nr:hypothetical protein GWI33_012044 [Rhynchophorus ferrugineus]